MISSATYKELVAVVVATAGRIFARPIATLVGSIGAAVIDGPLPIGDIFAVGGLIWTVYDVHSLRGDFEQQLQASLQKSINTMHQGVLTSLTNRKDQSLAEHIKAQKSIHAQSAKNLE